MASEIILVLSMIHIVYLNLTLKKSANGWRRSSKDTYALFKKKGTLKKPKLTFGLLNSWIINQFHKLVRNAWFYMHLGRSVEGCALTHAQYCYYLSRKVEFFAKQRLAIENCCAAKKSVIYPSATISQSSALDSSSGKINSIKMKAAFQHLFMLVLLEMRHR